MQTNPVVLTPAARNSDPISSHRAAEAMDRVGSRKNHQRRIVHLMALHYREAGYTSAELAHLIAELYPEEAESLNRHEVARRMPEVCGSHGTVMPLRNLPARKCEVGLRMSVPRQLTGSAREIAMSELAVCDSSLAMPVGAA